MSDPARLTDHGPGIDAEDLPHVVERFYRGAHTRSGSGLGLPIARQVAQGHGGDVIVRSPGPSGDGCQVEMTVRC